MEEKPGYLYRAYYMSYWAYGSDEPSVEMMFDVFEVIGATPKGVWLENKKWVSNTGRKRYAYPTIELAIDSLKHRLAKRRIHLRNAMLVNDASRLDIISKG